MCVALCQAAVCVCVCVVGAVDDVWLQVCQPVSGVTWSRGRQRERCSATVREFISNRKFITSLNCVYVYLTELIRE